MSKYMAAKMAEIDRLRFEIAGDRDAKPPILGLIDLRREYEKQGNEEMYNKYKRLVEARENLIDELLQGYWEAMGWTNG